LQVRPWRDSEIATSILYRDYRDRDYSVRLQFDPRRYELVYVADAFG
jgi:hypothetical protein